MQDALVYRDDGGTEADYDVMGMLQHLRFNDDGSMAFADIEGAKELFYHDCDNATARWVFERLTPERAGDTATSPISVKRFWEADLPGSFIICLQDRAQPRWLADVTAGASVSNHLRSTLRTHRSSAARQNSRSFSSRQQPPRPVGPLRPDG